MVNNSLTIFIKCVVFTSLDGEEIGESEEEGKYCDWRRADYRQWKMETNKRVCSLSFSSISKLSMILSETDIQFVNYLRTLI